MLLTDVPISEITILWHDDFYDGPIKGMAKWQGGHYYYSMYDEQMYLDEELDNIYQNRFYYLYELTPEEEAERFRIHNEFEEAKSSDEALKAFSKKYPPDSNKKMPPERRVAKFRIDRIDS